MALYRKELKRCNKDAGIWNKNVPVILNLLREKYALTNLQDVEFVKSKLPDYTAKLQEFEAQKNPAPSTRTTQTTSRRNDRMRFVECMTLDAVKPFYLNSTSNDKVSDGW